MRAALCNIRSSWARNLGVLGIGLALVVTGLFADGVPHASAAVSLAGIIPTMQCTTSPNQTFPAFVDCTIVVTAASGHGRFGDRLADAVAVRGSQLVLGLDPDPLHLWPSAAELGASLAGERAGPRVQHTPQFERRERAHMHAGDVEAVAEDDRRRGVRLRGVPGRAVVETLAPVPFFAGLLIAMGWAILGNPSNGSLNTLLSCLLHTARGPLNIYTAWGIIWVEGMHAAAFVYLLVLGAMRNLGQMLGIGIIGAVFVSFMPFNAFLQLALTGETTATGARAVVAAFRVCYLVATGFAVAGALASLGRGAHVPAPARAQEQSALHWVRRRRRRAWVLRARWPKDRAYAPAAAATEPSEMRPVWAKYAVSTGNAPHESANQKSP